jgi:DNA-directed RNA polymerase specialized sigma24 family protein
MVSSPIVVVGAQPLEQDRDSADPGVRAAVSTGATGSVEAVFREERGRLLAALVRQFGDLDLAEEVASDAVAAALER